LGVRRSATTMPPAVSRAGTDPSLRAVTVR
jgi:hypothetical protein